MANITRWDPFDELFKDFGGLLLRPVQVGGQAVEAPTIRVDVKEDNEGFKVHAELPGVKKEDIAVNIDGAMVSISAEKKQSGEQKDGERVLRTERYYGKVSRSFQLGGEIDEARASAKFNDGVLELVLPKKATAQARKLTVQ